ncbi:MAG: hypothetical protein AAGG48_14445 [Planctomycetota bacterium]
MNKKKYLAIGFVLGLFGYLAYAIWSQSEPDPPPRELTREELIDHARREYALSLCRIMQAQKQAKDRYQDWYRLEFPDMTEEI